MKTYEILLFTVTIVTCQSISYSQNDSLLTQSTPSTFQSNAFKVFTGGINAVYSNDRANGSLDVGVQTYHYFLVTGAKKKTDSLSQSSSIKMNYRDFKGFEFFLLNRAALNFDTSRSVANDYITSLQSSPLTLRFVKELFLTKQHEITSTNFSPVISIRLIGDSRAIPFQDDRRNLNFGASGHFYVTLSSQFTRLEFNKAGKELDRGTMYFQPSFGIALGTDEMMKSVYVDQQNKPLLSSECRLGFKSSSRTVNDCSFLIRYTISDIVGPKLRAGIILSSIN
jgi:hypothetical protein